MNKNVWWIILVLVAVGGFWLFSSRPVRNEGAPFTPERAEVVVLQDEVKSGLRLLKTGDSVEVGQTVATNATGRAEIKLPDGSLLRLGENARLTINSLGKTSLFKLLAGNLFARVAQAADRESFEVQTATTVATVRGTSFGQLSGKYYKLIGLKNKVEVGFLNKTARMNLGGGRQWVADPNKPFKDSPIFLTPEEKAWLKWNLEREAALGIRYDGAITALPSSESSAAGGDAGTPASSSTTGSSSSSTSSGSSSLSDGSSTNSNYPSSGTPWGQGPSQ